MKRYLLSVYQPGEVPPAGLDMDEVSHAVATLQDELKEAGAWVFAGSLHPPGTATVVRSDHGDVLMTDGPFSEAEEYIGGFTVISAPDLDAALAWGRMAAAASTLPVEVRPFRGDD